MRINRTALRTVEILQMLSENPEGITLDEICVRMDIPKTSAYDIVVTLKESGMVDVVKNGFQRYIIGLEAYRVGISYLNHLNHYQTIERELEKIAGEIKKTVFFGICSQDEVVYICKAEPENPIITTAKPGSRNPMYCTSLGKAILAYMEPEEKKTLMGRMTFQKRTEYTIANAEELEQELTVVREQGYAVDDREAELHMKCVGAPVFAAGGRLVGAISVAGLYQEKEDYGKLGRIVREKAEKISIKLGHFS